MVLDIINDYRERYKRLITHDPEYNEVYKWASIKKFQDHWDIDAPDFGVMYDNSLSNEISDNLWASKFFYPKGVMLDFIKLDQERVRLMFRELFDEEVDVEDRIDSFVFHCDQMRDEMLKTHSSFQNHYHDGFRIISLYLSFRFPMKYSIYKYTEFKQFMELVRAKSVPGTDEIGRFFKVMRTLYNLLAKDQELLNIHLNLRKGDGYYQDESLMLAQDFYWCCSRYNMTKY